MLDPTNLIWSIVIDVICYFLYPQFTMGQNMVMYISNGILFNYKYVGYNMLVVAGIQGIEYLFNLKTNIKTKQLAVNS